MVPWTRQVFKEALRRIRQQPAMQKAFLPYVERQGPVASCRLRPFTRNAFTRFRGFHSFHSSSIARHFHSCFGSRRKRLRQLGYHAVAIAADLFVTALLRFRAVPHRFASGIALAASLLTSSLEIWLHPYCLRLCGLWDRIGKSLLG